MDEEITPLRPQVYADPRPAEYFTRYYEHARTHGPDWVFDLARLLLTPLCLVVFRARSIDVANVPGAGPVILAPNHFSAMDHFFCGIFSRRRLRFMAKSQLFRPPLLNHILRRGGAFPVRRGRHDEESIVTARTILRGGGVLVMYPEGGRSRTARIGDRARPGIGRLALETGAPVLPVAIHGSLRARNWWRLRFPAITVRFGEPVRWEVREQPTREQQQEVADEVLGMVRGLYAGLEREGRRGALRRARERRPEIAA